MKKAAQNFTMAAAIAVVMVFMFSGCADFFHGEPAIYYVCFYNNSSVYDSRYIEAGLELGALPATPSGSGTFAGWYTGPNGSGTEYTASTIIKQNVNLYAAWGSQQNNVPSAPTGVIATGLSSTSISVSWNPVDGATGYKVYRSASPSGGYTLVIAGLSVPEYTDDGVSPSTTYYYKVSAVNSVGEGPQSDYASATTTSGAGEPSAPAGVIATGLSSTSIRVSWDPVGGATEYKVYRSASPSGEYTLVVAGLSVPEYTDTGVSPSTTYYYKVSAVNSVGEGPRSNYAPGTTTSGAAEPSAPAGVIATGLSSTSISVSWDPVDGATEYKVYRSASPSGEYTLVMTGLSVPEHTDTGVSPSTTYYYKVSAVNSVGEGPQSDYASATTTYSGATSADAIFLSSSDSWISGELNATSPEIWYTFYVPDNTVTCYLLGRDKFSMDGSGASYTSDVVFAIYDSTLELVGTIDAGNGGDYTLPLGTSNVNYLRETNRAGTWYAKVVRWSSDTSNYGTYAIYSYYQ